MTVTPPAYGEPMDEGDIAQMAHDSVPPEMWADPVRDLQDEQAERDVACWEDGDGSTCLLPDGHLSPHNYTPDSEIRLRF